MTKEICKNCKYAVVELYNEKRIDYYNYTDYLKELKSFNVEITSGYDINVWLCSNEDNRQRILCPRKLMEVDENFGCNRFNGGLK